GATEKGAAPRAARHPGSRGVRAPRPGNQPGRSTPLRDQAAAASRDRRRPVRLPGGGLGGAAAAARRRPRRRRDHDRRPPRGAAPGRRLGGPGGCGNRPARAARHEPQPHAHAGPGRRRAADAAPHSQTDPGGRGPARPRRAGATAQAMKARCTAARRHVARAVLGVVASWRLATGQGSGWVATPSSPTVGDTIWLERPITVPAGWRVRAGKLELAADVEPLGDPAVLRSPTGWVVRYPVVAWSPGPHRLVLPPVWRLGPAGRAGAASG